MLSHFTCGTGADGDRAMTASLVRTMSMIMEAAVASAAWSPTLALLAEAAGAVGAACVMQNNRTRQVEWTCVTGPVTGMTSAYLHHFAPLDPYLPLLEKLEAGRWLQLSEGIPDRELRHDEWYNDFVLRAGMVDAIGTRLFAGPSYTVVLAIHQERGTARSLAASVAPLTELVAPLSRAAVLHVERHRMEMKAALASRALDQLPTGVILTDADGQVIEINKTAERMMEADDGLAVHQGRIRAGRVFETTQLRRMIAAAATSNGLSPAEDRMLVGRRAGFRPYVVAVTRFAAVGPERNGRLVMLLIADPDRHTPAERDLMACFGLSHAEARLATALMSGRRLGDIATDRGLRITTLRTQLSAVLRKVGAKRQADLIGLLGDVGLVGKIC
jgi:DNA-binding CsgD family transcriptional regulator/PAS domain-containing protein